MAKKKKSDKMLKVSHRKPTGGRRKIQGSLTMSKKAHSPKKDKGKVKSYREFTKGKMSPYMKSEGGHAQAMQRISREWKNYKKKHGIK